MALSETSIHCNALFNVDSKENYKFSFSQFTSFVYGILSHWYLFMNQCGRVEDKSQTMPPATYKMIQRTQTLICSKVFPGLQCHHIHSILYCMELRGIAWYCEDRFLKVSWKTSTYFSPNPFICQVNWQYGGGARSALVSSRTHLHMFWPAYPRVTLLTLTFDHWVTLRIESHIK